MWICSFSQDPQFLYWQLWPPNLWGRCTTNGYGIFAKTYITSGLPVSFPFFLNPLALWVQFLLPYISGSVGELSQRDVRSHPSRAYPLKLHLRNEIFAAVIRWHRLRRGGYQPPGYFPHGEITSAQSADNVIPNICKCNSAVYCRNMVYLQH